MNRKKGESKLVFNKETRTIKPQISKMLEISRLKSRIKELEEEYKRCYAEIDVREARRITMTKTLEFYADEENYEERYIQERASTHATFVPAKVQLDRGAKATEVLNEEKES